MTFEEIQQKYRPREGYGLYPFSFGTDAHGVLVMKKWLIKHPGEDDEVVNGAFKVIEATTIDKLFKELTPYIISR